MTLNALNCYGETKICHSISLNLYIHLGKRFNDKTMYIFAVLCTLEHFNTSVNFVVMCIVPMVFLVKTFVLHVYVIINTFKAVSIKF